MNNTHSLITPLSLYHHSHLIDTSTSPKIIRRFWSNGTMEEGKFRNNQLVTGKRLLTNDTFEEGKFKNNELVKGERLLTNGNFEEGEFKRGRLVRGTIKKSKSSNSELVVKLDCTCGGQGCSLCWSLSKNPKIF